MTSGRIRLHGASGIGTNWTPACGHIPPSTCRAPHVTSRRRRKTTRHETPPNSLIPATNPALRARSQPLLKALCEPHPRAASESHGGKAAQAEAPRLLQPSTSLQASHATTRQYATIDSRSRSIGSRLKRPICREFVVTDAVSARGLTKRALRPAHLKPHRPYTSRMGSARYLPVHAPFPECVATGRAPHLTISTRPRGFASPVSRPKVDFQVRLTLGRHPRASSASETPLSPSISSTPLPASALPRFFEIHRKNRPPQSRPSGVFRIFPDHCSSRRPKRVQRPARGLFSM
ncbi:hypothetical protein GGQ74_000458 [Desulfobaculum xiamenense]|uniref:Uncharacterized protein n=1 Tax=Desulfobaculum xiamenense TaxID=995050 RepID=A0A846QEN1_9BACT|nr:hypothetical protein [Desulfobaculum xiamenense]